LKTSTTHIKIIYIEKAALNILLLSNRIKLDPTFSENKLI